MPAFSNDYYDYLETDFGRIYMVLNQTGLVKVALAADDWQEYLNTNPCRQDSRYCQVAVSQLQEYLQGNRQQFTVPYQLGGTAFFLQVWHQLLQIPYGTVKSYATIAAEIGNPRAYRAVGMANSHNPLPIIIPCHRVIGTHGHMTGYKGKHIEIKKYLLHVEGTI